MSSLCVDGTTGDPAVLETRRWRIGCPAQSTSRRTRIRGFPYVSRNFNRPTVTTVSLSFRLGTENDQGRRARGNHRSTHLLLSCPTSGMAGDLARDGPRRRCRDRVRPVGPVGPTGTMRWPRDRPLSPNAAAPPKVRVATPRWVADAPPHRSNAGCDAKEWHKVWASISRRQTIRIPLDRCGSVGSPSQPPSRADRRAQPVGVAGPGAEAQFVERGKGNPWSDRWNAARTALCFPGGACLRFRPSRKCLFDMNNHHL